jgi:hypothetical protein
MKKIRRATTDVKFKINRRSFFFKKKHPFFFESYQTTTQQSTTKEMKIVLAFIFACLYGTALCQPVSNETQTICTTGEIPEFMNGFKEIVQDNDFNQYLDKMCLFYFDKYIPDDTSTLDIRAKQCIRSNLEYYTYDTKSTCTQLVQNFASGCCTDQCYVMACSNVTKPKGRSFNCTSEDTVGKLNLMEYCVQQYSTQMTCAEAARVCLVEFNFNDFLYGNILGGQMLDCYQKQEGSCDTNTCFKKTCGFDRDTSVPSARTSLAPKNNFSSFYFGLILYTGVYIL